MPAWIFPKRGHRFQRSLWSPDRVSWGYKVLGVGPHRGPRCGVASVQPHRAPPTLAKRISGSPKHEGGSRCDGGGAKLRATSGQPTVSTAQACRRNLLPDAAPQRHSGDAGRRGVAATPGRQAVGEGAPPRRLP
jgi:hypothetical protein